MTLIDSYNTKLYKIVKSTMKNIKSQNFDLEIPSDFIKFNELIGLPLHPSMLQPMPLMPYQKEFIRDIPQDRNRLFHINKARQIGVTELILRVLAYHCFFKYRGGRILILAGCPWAVCMTNNKIKAAAAKSIIELLYMQQYMTWLIQDQQDYRRFVSNL